jgi:hypothetical protein
MIHVLRMTISLLSGEKSLWRGQDRIQIAAGPYPKAKQASHLGKFVVKSYCAIGPKASKVLDSVVLKVSHAALHQGHQFMF